MDEWEMECHDCGWRGLASALIEDCGHSGNRSAASCPECGGSEFKKRAEMDQKEDA